MKNSSQWWVVVVKTSLMTSSSLRFAPDHALAAPALPAEGVDRLALHVAGAGDRDDHVLLGDEVLDVDLALVGLELRPARVRELLADLERAPP